ncbi:hypothetical protein OGM63_15625 [Plectonema radiosum NIES-515]|uniref:Ribbon-helix-helix protein CopG domain-containing protein n=1 Tax=Plectonema radiosum NIES-515 TaxID=2986073 RepID=A0ABT3B0M5_9CYAN|nr:hypothetical protein [Plectonema radiosum]MCV3214927.1 hypothetical protein [Plectonema radiosum NIES-515]
MATKKHPVPAYLDDYEFEKLVKIAAKWGGSLSAAIKRMIRENEDVGE